MVDGELRSILPGSGDHAAATGRGLVLRTTVDGTGSPNRLSSRSFIAIKLASAASPSSEGACVRRRLRGKVVAAAVLLLLLLPPTVYSAGGGEERGSGGGANAVVIAAIAACDDSRVA